LLLSCCVLTVLAATTASGYTQKIVDPGTVAPEYREAAEKRRAEQLVLIDCTRKADGEKIIRRERAAWINQCVEAASKK